LQTLGLLSGEKRVLSISPADLAAAVVPAVSASRDQHGTRNRIEDGW
jgi:hypothetical protein